MAAAQALIEEFRLARRDPALAVLEGLHPLKHALRFGARVSRAVAADRTAVLALAEQLAPDVAEAVRGLVEEVPPEAFAQLVPRPPHTGVVALAERPPAPAPDAIARDAPSVLLEDPRDPANVGACVRVAAAAGAAAVHVTGDRDPWSPDALRGSAGLHFALPVLHGTPPDDGRPLVAFDPDGDPFDPAALPAGAILAFGSERAGLSDALLARAGARLTLPMRPGVSSLNLATSVSAVLFAWRLR